VGGVDGTKGVVRSLMAYFRGQKMEGFHNSKNRNLNV